MPPGPDSHAGASGVVCPCDIEERTKIGVGGDDRSVRRDQIYVDEGKQARELRISATEIFDVAMLSGNMAHPQPWMGAPVPFCPLLTQGWNLVRAYGVTLPDVLTTASRFLANSLWSTFTKRGTSIIFDAIKSG